MRTDTYVLVVENEPLLLLMAGDLVEQAGFLPIYAKNAAEAVDILERRSDVCIVFTDVDMPGGMNGIELAALVRDRWPPIQFIVVSGHLNVMSDNLPDKSRFFRKPYDSSRIVDALTELAA